MPSNVAPYLYSSTIQYPLDALLELGGKIVEDLWAHHVTLRNAARASGDTTKEDAEGDELNDIWVALPQIDMITYQERLVDPDYVRGAVPSKEPEIMNKRKEMASEQPTKQEMEKGLLMMGRAPKIPVVRHTCPLEF